MARILVTGATGFVGSAVARALLSSNHEVMGLVRDPRRADELAARGMTVLEGDMTAPASYVPTVEGVDAVIHTAQLAVPGRLTPARAREVFRADAVMTSPLAGACVRSNRRLVYTGGCFDWGDRGEAWIDEATPLDPSPMGVGHARQARFLDEAHTREGLDVVRLSPGFVYGPGGLLKSAFVDQARQRRLRCIGRGQNWWSCVHVDDLAAAYVAAVTSAAPGAVYAVTDGEPIRLRDLTDCVTDAMGAPRVGSAPKALLRAFLGRTLVNSLVTSFKIDPSRIRKDLRWAPRHPRFQDGVVVVVTSTP